MQWSFRKKKIDIDKIEKEINEKETERDLTSKTYGQMISEATNKLKTAVTKKDLVQISVAQSMIEAAKKVKHQISLKSQDIDKCKKNVAKRKSTMLDKFIGKMQKQ